MNERKMESLIGGGNFCVYSILKYDAAYDELSFVSGFAIGQTGQA